MVLTSASVADIPDVMHIHLDGGGVDDVQYYGRMHQMSRVDSSHLAWESAYRKRISRTD
jgi:hypothetical protein